MPSLANPPTASLPTELDANGCFETMRAYGGRIFRLEDHLDRLQGSVRYLGLAGVPPREELRRRLTSALADSGLHEAVVRIALMPRGRGTVVPSVVVRPVEPPTAAQYRRGIQAAIVPTRKFSVNMVDARTKYSARLSSVLAVTEAQLRGVDEALFMDALGLVTESTASNFCIIKRRALITPPCWLGLLRGITRDVMEELARALGIPFHEVPLTRHDIYNADEALLTSTIKEVLAVTSVDGRTIGTGRPGPFSRRLRRAFRALVAQEMRHGRH